MARLGGPLAQRRPRKQIVSQPAAAVSTWPEGRRAEPDHVGESLRDSHIVPRLAADERALERYSTLLAVNRDDCFAASSALSSGGRPLRHREQWHRERRD